ncbi:TIR domain-containing protein [Salinimicrobium catena]|uniref:TIR domain-containing protein n=1 Tax=Salinimicrobium catena TaxID=390640 RepID=UPI002FE4E55D
MELKKAYSQTKFSSQRLREIFEFWEGAYNNLDKPGPIERNIEIETESWKYDSDTEFFSEYDKQHSYSSLYKSFYLKREKEDPYLSIALKVRYYYNETTVTIKGIDRIKILEIKNFIEENIDSYFLSQEEPGKTPKQKVRPVVFIGHGGSPDWRDLKDHLADKHKIEVVAYETGARAGHTIRDILDEMLIKSSFAVLIMTAEDEQADGTMNARSNVIHEVGLFQGKLGFNKAIVALEKGTNLFSNLDGIHQLRFSSGNIKEIFGDVVAVINREFNQ